MTRGGTTHVLTEEVLPTTAIEAVSAQLGVVRGNAIANLELGDFLLEVSKPAALVLLML